MKSVSNIIGNYRWTVVALLFFSTTINYMDRQVIGYLKLSFSSPVSEGGLGWSNKDYAIITSAFTMFYALMTFGVGFIIDKIGTKIGLTMSLENLPRARRLKCFSWKFICNTRHYPFFFRYGRSR